MTTDGWASTLTRRLVPGAAIVMLAAGTQAELYSYKNDDGDYVVTRTQPQRDDYVVLSDEGEFVRRVVPTDDRIPITHWRPWFIPKEPHPFDYQPPELRPAPDPTPIVTVEEVDKTSVDETSVDETSVDE